MTTQSTICKGCNNVCPMHADIEAGRVVKVMPVKGHPAHMGFSCKRGRELPQVLSSPARLLHSMKRNDDGSYSRIAIDQATDEIAAKLQAIIAAHGPRAVASYFGTYCLGNVLSSSVGYAFMAAIGSPMIFTLLSIDCPGRFIADALHGRWLGRGPTIADAQTVLLVGANPAISFLGPIPFKWRYRDAQRRGGKLIVIDPRRSETAMQADIFLQARPREDPSILAAMLNVIFREGLEDRDFLAAHATGVKELREAVLSFTPELAAARADIAVADIIAAAHAFAHGRGVCYVGTGPNMSGFGVLTEYLALCLMTVTGTWNRAGDEVPDFDVLIHTPPSRAQVLGPFPGWGFGEKLRVRGLTGTAAGLQTAALADEILLEGEGQVRAMISIGGNPATAWPDQIRTDAALKKLELLVSVDPEMNLTSQYADYVIAPRVAFEFPADSTPFELMRCMMPNIGTPPVAYGQLALPIAQPPPGSQVIDDWKFLHGLARRMGVALKVAAVSRSLLGPQATSVIELAPDDAPTSLELHRLMFEGSPVPYEQVLKQPDGFFPEPKCHTVQEAERGASLRLQVGDDAMLAQLRALAHVQEEQSTEFPFRLLSRRQAHRYNSAWQAHHRDRASSAQNPAFMHPDDLARLGLVPGQEVEISSARATIRGIVEVAPELRPGLVSMMHSWGAKPGDAEDPKTVGSSTARLNDSDQFEQWSGIPRMSAVPVAVRAAGMT